jgi:hypothetical protein
MADKTKRSKSKTSSKSKSKSSSKKMDKKKMLKAAAALAALSLAGGAAYKKREALKAGAASAKQKSQGLFQSLMSMLPGRSKKAEPVKYDKEQQKLAERREAARKEYVAMLK